MTIAVLLSVLQPAWAIEEAAEIDAVAASRNLIVVVPGIIGSELVDGNGAKVWVGPVFHQRQPKPLPHFRQRAHFL